MPYYNPATNENKEVQLPGSSSPFDAQDQITQPSPCSDHVEEFQQRKLSDDLLETRSIGLMFPQNLPGMKYHKVV